MAKKQSSGAGTAASAPSASTAPGLAQLDWDHLRIFLAVARHASALEAAGPLGLDHSTVSRRLRRLEAQLGSALLTRSPRGHALTAAGQRLLESAERVEAALLLAQADLGGDASALTGQVRLGSTEGLGAYFLAPRLADFCERHPGLRVDLLALPRTVNLSQREADLAVCLEPPSSTRWVRQPLCHYRLRAYATAGYLASHPPLRSPADLAAHRFIGYVDELVFSAELRYLDGLAPGAAVPLRCTGVVAQLHAARQGQGIAVLPCFMASSYADLIPVLPEAVHVVRQFWLVASPERLALARVRTLWDDVQDAAHSSSAFLMGDAPLPGWMAAGPAKPQTESATRL
ncbi:LysR family transcriptional regulator [Amphibiibacter pelophylacis]|uniref:LysR family transcriptional regulator n=1 Tax=Amphibiibacter pelophylacis TaxID=1799477 RepID=A0ACC6P1E4_9BURK